MSLLGRNVGFVFLTSYAFFLANAAFADSVLLQGRVTDTANGQAIEGVMVGLDLVPADGIFEYQTSTDPFGFFKFEDVDNSQFELLAQHPAYLDSMVPVDLRTGGSVPIQLEMTPILGTFLDVFVQVSGITSGKNLEAVPLAILQFTEPDAPDPVRTITAVTDADGQYVFRGLVPGFYLMRVNDPLDGTVNPKWEPYTTEDLMLPNGGKVALNQDHFASALLKPVMQNFTVKVTGFDPVSETADAPLANAVVELSGVDCGVAAGAPIVPVRTAVTDANGIARFSQLPAICWDLVVKKAGYEMATPQITVEPDANGDFIPGNTGTNPRVVPLNLLFNQLYLYLHSPYGDVDPLIYFGLNVQLQGTKDTATEGILRDGRVAEGFDQQFFANLVPGKYRVFVEGQAANAFFPVRPYFSASAYVDVAQGQWTDFHLDLDVAPAIIRGRLFAAETSGEIPELGFLTGPPIYQAKQQVGIAFIEKEADPLLPLGQRQVLVDTDAEGYFTFEILPSLYGIQIQALDTYFGSHIRSRNQSTDIAAEKEIVQGWPFYQTWPAAFVAPLPPSNGTGKAGEPLVFRSKQEYQLDLFIRRQRNHITGEVVFDGADPTPGDLVWEQSGRATLTSMARGNIVESELDQGAGGRARFLFRDLPPGTYTLGLAHPRNTFTYDGSSTPFEVTLDTWQAPGVLPLTDPLLRGPELPFDAIDLPDSQAIYTPSTTTLNFEYKRWNGVSYESFAGPPGFSFKEVAYTGDFRFAGGIPVGPFTFWVRVLGCGSPAPIFQGEITAEGANETFKVFCGGDMNNTTPGLPPNPVVQSFRVVSAADPTYFVENTEVQLSGAPAVTISEQGQPFVFSSLMTVTGADNDNWVFSSAATRVDNPVTLEYITTVLMARGTRIVGEVTRNTPSRATEGIEGAIVQVLDRYGNVLRETETDASGNYSFAANLPGSQTIFMDIRAPGFEPFRRRFTPGQDQIIIPDPLDPQSQALMTVNALLKPLPAPQVGSVGLDRAGMFLTGVRKVGNQDSMSAAQAAAALTLTFEVSGSAPHFSYDLPAYDRPNGSVNAVEMVEITDPISEIWLVDPRQFPDQPARGSTVPGNPYSDVPVTLTLPDESNYRAVRNFLDKLGESGAAQVTYAQAHFLQTDDVSQMFTGRGTLGLWTLPPGDFQPVLIVVSKRGAIKIHPVAFTGALMGRELKGAVLPPWLAFVGEALDIAASLPEPLREEALKQIQPSGRFTIRPQFSLTVQENASFPGFLIYDYDLGVSLKEGIGTPASGMLGYAPGTLGLQLNANASMKLLGKEQILQFGVSGSATTTDDLDISEYLPKRLFGLRVENPTLRPGIEVSTLFSNILNPADPLESRLTHSVSGSVISEVELNLNRFTGKIPSLGPILKVLDTTKILQTSAVLSGAAKLTSQTSWNTLRPRQFETGSTTFDHRLRRHVFGGNEDVVPPAGLENKFRLGLNLGLGLRLKILNGRGKATGSLVLQGEKVDFPQVPEPVPVAQIETNLQADWPMVTRIRGALAARLDASLDLTLIEFNKSWEWELFKFEHEFGTDSGQKRAATINPVFDWIPLHVNTIAVGPEPGDFMGGEPLLVNNFTATGSYDLAMNQVPGNLFTDWDADRSLSVLHFSQRQNPASWTAPVLVAEAPAMVAAALHGLADGRWLAVWSQIEAAQLQNPFASHDLYYSLGTSDGLSWSAAQQITSLGGTAFKLRLTSNAVNTQLIFLDSESSGVGSTPGIKGMVFDGVSWGSVTLLQALPNLLDFDAAGAGHASMEPTQILSLLSDGTIQTIAWDGTAQTGPEVLGTEGNGAGSVISDGAGRFFAACFQPGTGLTLFEKIGAAVWTPLATLPLATQPSQLAAAFLDDSGSPGLQISWLTSGSDNGVHTLATSLSGALVAPESAVAKASLGDYERLRTLGLSGLTALVGVLFDNGPELLQMFTVGAFAVQIAPQAGLAVSEGGPEDQFEVRLSQAPTHTVTIPLSINVAGEAQLSSQELVFTPENGTDPLSVGVAGISDGRVDGDQLLIIETGAPVSDDPFFSGLTAGQLPDIQVWVIDDGRFAPPQAFFDQAATWPVNSVLDLVALLNSLTD